MKALTRTKHPIPVALTWTCLAGLPGRYLFAGFGVQSVSTRTDLNGATVVLLAVAHAQAQAAVERAQALGLEHGLLGQGSAHWDDTETRKGSSTSRTSRASDSDKVSCPT